MTGVGGQLLPRPLLDALLEDRVLPLVGAGFSLNAELPPDRTMPAWAELASVLEEEVRFVAPNADAIEVISAYAAEHGRQALVTRLRVLLNEGWSKPGEAHRAFSQLPFDTVVTTNFDTLLEDTYRDARRPLLTVVREDQLTLQGAAGAVSLIKAHGDLSNEPVLIATEEDYDEFLLRRPLLATYVANLLITSVPLLIGYSLSDPDWRQLLASVRSRLGRSRQTVYALEVDADPVTVERFRRRDVTVINLPSNGEGYARALASAFAEMRAHVARHALDDITVRDEGALEELRSTTREERRLCLFLVPESLLAFYREQVFPRLRQAGVTPITSFDVDARRRTAYATTIALIEQVAAIVIDLSDGDNATAFEARLALSADRQRRGKLAVVVGRDSAPVDVVAAEGHLIQLSLDAPGFAEELREWAVATLGAARPPATARPQAGEEMDPNWEIVRAFRDLELVLRDHYPEGVPTLVQLLHEAERDERLPADAVRKLREDFRLRNRVLHERYSASPAEADRVRSNVSAALARLAGGTG